MLLIGVDVEILRAGSAATERNGAPNFDPWLKRILRKLHCYRGGGAICPRADYDLITAIFWRISRGGKQLFKFSPP